MGNEVEQQSFARPSPNIVVMGGGTGSFNLLTKLKYYTPNITALVSMFDNGGSSGGLRDEYGVLPPGDARQCLVALSDAPMVRDLFDFRFGEGSINGHSAGNLIITAYERLTGDPAKAIKLAGQLLKITGRVLPITTDSANLIIQDGDREIVGEHQIEGESFNAGQRPGMFLRPTAAANPEAVDALREADIIVLPPGSLYESIISNFLVDGIPQAVAERQGHVVQVVNLVTKPGHTDNWRVDDYVTEVERFAGKGVVHTALYNTQLPTPEMLGQYARDGEYPVQYDAGQVADRTYDPVGMDLVHIHTEEPNANDALAVERTLIRHDADTVSRFLMKLYFS